MMRADREAAQAALQALSDRHGGRLTPEMVVEAAQAPDSPLHAFFEWDDVRAATHHRIEQARTLIRSVHLMVSVERTEVRAPFFVRDPARASHEQGYVSLPRLRDDAEAARAALVMEFARAAAALTRARALAAALGLNEEVATLADRLDALRAKVATSNGAAAAQLS